MRNSSAEHAAGRNPWPPLPTAAPLLYAALAWAGGILLHRAGFSPGPAETALAAALLAALGACCAWRRRNVEGWLAALAALLILSAAWSAAGERESPRSVAALAEKESLFHPTVTLEGVLVSMPVHAAFVTTLDVDVRRLSFWDGKARARRTFEPLSGIVRVRVDGSPRKLRRLLPLGMGDRVRLKTTLYHPKTHRNEGGFDYADHLRHRGIELSAHTRSPFVVERVEEARGVRRLLRNARRAAEDALARHFPGDTTLLDREGGILTALATGNRAHLTPEDSRRFKDTGVFHILAISGLHVGVLAFGAFFAVRLLGAGPRAGAAAALLSLVFFAAFVDARASVLRAALMAGLYFAGKLLSWRAHPLNFLGAAALALLLLRPGDLFDVGFQLTFGATLAILVLLLSLPAAKPSLRRSLGLAAGISCAAQAVTGPVILQTFHRVSTAGILLNLWVVPLAGILMKVLALFLLTAVWSEGAGMVFEAVLRAVLTLMLAPVEFAAAHGGWFSFVRLPPAAPWKVLLYYALLVAAALLPASRLPHLRRAAWAAWALSALTLVTSLPSAPRESLAVHVLDVGQGQSVLMEFPGRGAMLADGGGVRGRRFDVGENVVSSFLLSRGIRRLDVVAVTAPRADHVYGVERALRNFPVGELWLPHGSDGAPVLSEVRRIAEERNVRVVWARAGQSLETGGARVEVLAPHETCRDKDAFLAFSVRFAGRAILVPSDIRGSEEGCLARLYGERLRHDVLLLPMHGSASASGGTFLDAVAPRLALVSVGRNPWKWPSEKTLARLAARNIPLLRTDRDGQIRVEILPNGTWRVETPAGP